MTKEEIKALVASKIEGQGTNLDAASVLPTILNWIIDNMGGDNPLADSFVDVGEFHQNNLMIVDGETAIQLMTKALLIKSGAGYYPRTSDILIDPTVVSNYLANLEPEGVESVRIQCTFGTISWISESQEIESITAISLINYYDANSRTRKDALYYYEL